MGKYSQFGEEAHLWAILDEIGDGSKVCVDIGARYAGSNVAALIRSRGYSAYLVEASLIHCKELINQFPGADVINKFATIENINELVPMNTHVLSIDVDSNDWWLWANLRARPAVVIIETSPCKGIRVSEYNMNGTMEHGYGTSVDGAKALANLKRYTYITRTEANVFFVNNDIKCNYRAPDAKSHCGSPSSPENNIFR